MSQAVQLLELLKKYYIKLGYEESFVRSRFDKKQVSEMVVMKLANSNIIIKNKTDRSSHQTHIAITGDTIKFFKTEIEMLSSPSETTCIEVYLSSANINDLNQVAASIENPSCIDFAPGKVSIGKRTQNQIQLSKRSSDNSDNFNALRNGLVEDDLLFLIRDMSTSKVYIWGIPKSFYMEIIPDFSQRFNSNIYIELNGQEKMEDSYSSSICFELFAEKGTEAGVNCYLCGCSLAQYMENLPDSYNDNEIQRGIVKNVYLDRLVDTIMHQDNIPTITLVGQDITVSDDGKHIEMSNFKILDGLQRTHRIHEIWKCMKYFQNRTDQKELTTLSKFKLTRLLSKDLAKHGCDISIFWELLSEYKLNESIDRYWKYFLGNVQWFEIWENLTLKDETKKMLVLNAGHRQMDIRHQLELLFLNVLPMLNQISTENGNKEIIRNKDKSDTMYSKNRIVGEYYFSHIISAALSYICCSEITTNAELISDLQDKTIPLDENSAYESMQRLMCNLMELDHLLYTKYGDVGVKWIARETVLVGLFAAIGKYEQKENVDGFKRLYSRIDGLNLMEYESSKDKSVEISKVNIGNITKKAVSKATTDLLSSDTDSFKIEWSVYFGGTLA